MLSVGLTGSIAVGKSFVSEVLTECGCYVLDADRTAREVVLPGTIGLQSVVAEFGVEVLHIDGTLDRGKLGALIFNDDNQRARLNAILHPLIRVAHEEWLRGVAATDSRAVAVIDAALMIESGSYQMFDQLIVAHCRPEIQLDRLVKRNKLAGDEAARRIASQMPQEEKMRFADFLIDTSNGFEEARRRTVEVSVQLKRLAEMKGA